MEISEQGFYVSSLYSLRGGGGGGGGGLERKDFFIKSVAGTFPPPSSPQIEKFDKKEALQ